MAKTIPFNLVSFIALSHILIYVPTKLKRQYYYLENKILSGLHQLEKRFGCQFTLK